MKNCFNFVNVHYQPVAVELHFSMTDDKDKNVVRLDNRSGKWKQKRNNINERTRDESALLPMVFTQ